MTLQSFRALIALVILTVTAVEADEAKTESADGLRLAAHHPLQARQTYQIVQHRQGDRWLLYVGHLRGSEPNPRSGRVEENGSSAVDVTDPRRPRFLVHIPPTDAPWFDGDAIDRSGGQSVRGTESSGRTRTSGTARPAKPISSPASRAGPGQVLQVFDLADPSEPRHIRDFGLPGTQPGGTTGRGDGFSLHEATVLGDRVYLAYGTNHDGVIQILDRKKLLGGDHSVDQPLAPTDESLRYPELARLEMPEYWGGHSAKPIMDVPIADYAAFAAPVGSYLGGIIGWRGVFWVLVPIVALNPVWQWAALPSLPAAARQSFRSLMPVLKRPYFARGIVAVTFTFVGAFAMFTYLRPFLETVTGANVTTLTRLFLALGCAGFLGIWAGGKFANGRVIRLLQVLPVVMGLVTLGLLRFGEVVVVTAVLLAIWGAMNTAMSIRRQGTRGMTKPGDFKTRGYAPRYRLATQRTGNNPAQGEN